MKRLLRRFLARVVRWRWDCGFYANDGRLSTEIIIPNPQMGPIRERLGSKLTILTFYRPDGRVAARRVVLAPLGRNRIIRVGRIRGLPAFGQVKVTWIFPVGQARGGNRTVFHWYYRGGMTCVHEKKEPKPPASRVAGRSLRPGQGYMTLFGVPLPSPLDLYLVCLSQDWLPSQVRLRRFSPKGDADVVSPAFTVPPWGTAFVNVRELLADAPEALVGPLAIDAAPYALSYYYFVHNRQDGTWQAQHL